jgi:tRNA threonylcarbamoyl adenosine modification protein YeaZ
MWQLAIETIGLSGSIALFSDQELVASQTLPDGIGSARSLLPAVNQLLLANSLGRQDLGWVSLANGPGSFTGLRVSVATAKAIGYALHIPIVAVDSLEALIYKLVQRYRSEFSSPYWVAVAMDAYRKQVFRSVAWVGPELLTQQSPQPQSLPKTSERTFRILLPSHHLDAVLWKENPLYSIPAYTHIQPEIQVEQAIYEADLPVVLGGNGVTRYPILAPAIDRITASDGSDITAADVGRYAWTKWQQQATIDPFSLLPNYLRSSAAEEKAQLKSES